MARDVTITTPSDREVLLTREFDAPSALVFDALTQPELLRRWYGPTGWTLIVCEIELKVDGAWHFVVQRPDGKKFGQLGNYRVIKRPHLIVNTETWDDWDAGETLVTTSLSERAGKTTFQSNILFPSQEVRDIVVKGGLEHGTAESYQKLDDLLSSLNPPTK